jgi:hypothetical protein
VIAAFDEALFKLISFVIVCYKLYEIVNFMPFAGKKIIPQILKNFTPVVVESIQWFLEIVEPQSLAQNLKIFVAAKIVAPIHTAGVIGMIPCIDFQ